MILERLVLDNFRQFKGRQEIVFSDLKERNVTIVHAENGFGKTTVLKSLLWALIRARWPDGGGWQEEDFEKPDEIINEGEVHRGGDPGHIAAMVQLTFKHDESRYILTRKLTLAQQKLNPKQTELSLEMMRDGQTFALDRPQQRILAIVPEGISGFLFFNGERINYLAMERNSAQVTEAIHQMLGLRLLKTTIDDLGHQNVRGKLRAEQRETTNEEKRELIERLTQREADLRELEEQRRQTQVNLAAIASELEVIDNKLVANVKPTNFKQKEFV
jgi:DNA sulfur modification protein DndD